MSPTSKLDKCHPDRGVQALLRVYAGARGHLYMPGRVCNFAIECIPRGGGGPSVPHHGLQLRAL